MNSPALRHIACGSALLATEAVGSGTPVVFLHANVCDRRMWRSQIDAVGARHRAIAYDRRGFGETQAETEDFSAVADLMAVIDAVAGDAPAILVGCSMGGRIAINAALRHPSRVRGLVLIAPGVSGAPDPVYPPRIGELMAEQRAAVEAGALERINAIAARLWLDGPLADEGRIQGPVRELFLDMNGIALRSPPFGTNRDAEPAFQRLHEIAVPTLAIQGNLDFPHIQERSRHIAAAIPHAMHRELPGAAHLPSLEQPAQTTGAIAEFVSRA